MSTKPRGKPRTQSPTKNGVVPRSQRPPATFGPEDISSQAEAIYSTSSPKQWSSARSQSPLLTRHYGKKPPAEQRSPSPEPRAEPAAPMAPPVWPKPAGGFSNTLLLQATKGPGGVQTMLLTKGPGSSGRQRARPATPPGLHEELKWVAPPPLEWVSFDDGRRDPAAEAAALAAERAAEVAEAARRDANEAAEAARIQREAEEAAAAERAKRRAAEEAARRVAEEAALREREAERARLEAEERSRREAARERSPGEKSRKKNDRTSPPRAAAYPPRPGLERFPTTPLKIRDFDELLHLYAADLGETLMGSGVLSFDLDVAQAAVLASGPEAVGLGALL